MDTTPSFQESIRLAPSCLQAPNSQRLQDPTLGAPTFGSAGRPAEATGAPPGPRTSPAAARRSSGPGDGASPSASGGRSPGSRRPPDDGQALCGRTGAIHPSLGTRREPTAFQVSKGDDKGQRSKKRTNPTCGIPTEHEQPERKENHGCRSFQPTILGLDSPFFSPSFFWKTDRHFAWVLGSVLKRFGSLG